MARPTQTRLTAEPGFAPDVTRAPQLGVYAPLNVQTGPSGAEQLASALGMVSKVAAPAIADYAEKKAYAGATQGQVDAKLGKVDEKRAKEDHAYDMGQKRGVVEKTTIEAIAEWQAGYDKMDKSMGEDAVVADFNSFMEKKLSPFAKDADASQWLLNRLGPAEQQIRQTTRATLSAQYKEDMVATAGGMIRESLATKQPVDPEAIKSVLIGAGFTRGEATAQYVDSIGALAVETHNSRLLDMLIPEKWNDGQNGPRSIPALANKINQYRFYADQGAESEKREAKLLTQQHAEQAQISVMQAASKGDISGALKMLDDAVSNGMVMTASDYSSMKNFVTGQRDDFREQSMSPAHIAQFRTNMMENPTAYTPQDALTFVTNNFPRGKDGLMQAGQFLDDFNTAYKSAQAAETNPVAKAYRTSLTTQFKPETYDSDKKRNRFAAGMQAFDLSFAREKDPEAALAAANKVFEGTKGAAEVASGSTLSDAAAFGTGKLSGRAILDKYPSVDAFREAARKKQIDEPTARKLQQLYITGVIPAPSE